MLAIGMLLTVAAYRPALSGPFVLDDIVDIAHNPALTTLWPPTVPMREGGRLPHRPLPYYSFALNRAVHGLDPWGYHAVNLAIHLANGCLLAWLTTAAARRASARPHAPHAAWLGAATGAVWLVHPLCTQAVAYVYQRMEIMAALAILATLCCFERGLRSPRRWGWWGAAGVASGLGMACKETAVVAPVLVLLYDGLLVARPWRVPRRRLAVHGLLFATWIVLGIVVWDQHRVRGYAEFEGSALPPIGYLLNQPAVILHYLRLAAWPAGLCFDHHWQPAGSALAVLPACAVVAAAAAATAVAAWRGRAWAFLPAASFTLLAPTSSVMPVVDLCAEHRMYLPLATVVAGAAIAVHRLAGLRTLAVASACVAGALTAATAERCRLYGSREALWRDCIAKAPANPRAWECLGQAALDAGDRSAAEAAIGEALRLDPGHAPALLLMGNVLRDRDPDAAIGWFRRALAARPRDVATLNNLGALLGMRGDPRAESLVREALRLDPRNVEAHSNLANLALARGSVEEAREWFARAHALDPADPVAARNLAAVGGRVSAAEDRPPAPGRPER